MPKKSETIAERIRLLNPKGQGNSLARHFKANWRAISKAETVAEVAHYLESWCVDKPFAPHDIAYILWQNRIF